MESKELESQSQWDTVGRPGFQGKEREKQTTAWNNKYGEGNWRIAWEMASGETFNMEQVFWQVYVAGYTRYFQQHPDEASWITKNSSYVFDKDNVTKDEAFDYYSLLNKPGYPNQFHHTAINASLQWFLGIPFEGARPLQVREGSPDSRCSTWPEGWQWSPGRVPAVKPQIIGERHIDGWWQKNSIEDVYQSTKVLQVRKRR